MQACDILLQLAVAAWLGQRHVADVVIQVNVLVLHPNRVGQVQWHQRQFAGEHLGQVQTLLDVSLCIFKEIPGVAFGQVQHIKGAYVHGHFW